MPFLADEQRRKDDARDDVAPQLGAPAASQQRESRHSTTETVWQSHERTLNPDPLPSCDR